MADVDDGDILRLGCGLSFQGVYDVVNVWHTEWSLATGLAWAAAIVTIQAWAELVYGELNATLVDLIGTNIISVANATQQTTLGSIEWSPTWGGADTSEATPPGVACFTWARTYKPRVQIRKYFGVFGEGNLTDGVWSAAVQTACIEAMDVAVDKTVVSAGREVQAVAYNRALSTIQYGVSTDSSAEPAYQRRRKRGRGS